ncbi:MAG TPA: tetratricopeptide repeat protein [Phycisphaerales bacterium]|nr:tetratricopeptide repeat protein [Phycisphaerales bacterium]
MTQSGTRFWREVRSALACTAACALIALAGGCENSGKAHAGRSPDTRGQTTSSEAADPRAVAYVKTAEQAIRDGDLDKALQEFEHAIEVNPNYTEAHLGMADIYRMQGRYDRAEQKYARACQLQPRNFDAQYFHGLMLHLLDRLPEAIQAYIRALAINPSDFKANLNIATAYYQLDENTQALPYARRAVELKPDDGPARFNLGAIYAAMNRHGDAVREYTQAAEFMSLTPPLLLNLADSLAKLDRYEEMANALMQALKAEPSAIAYERLGYARFKLGQYGDARQNFNAAVRMDDSYYPALNGLGVCYLNDWIKGGRQDAGTKETGLNALRRSLQINRDQPQILEILTRYGR